MKTDIEIAQEAVMEPITKVAESIGIEADDLELYGKYKAKLSEEFSKDKFKNLDERMEFTFDQVSEELDRNIELLKRFQIEERHDLISKQIVRSGFCLFPEQKHIE